MPCLFVYISSVELSTGETYLTQQMEGLNDRFATRLTDSVHCTLTSCGVSLPAGVLKFRLLSRSVAYSPIRLSFLLTRLASKAFELVPVIDHRPRISKEASSVCHRSGNKTDRDEQCTYRLVVVAGNGVTPLFPVDYYSHISAMVRETLNKSCEGRLRV